MLPHREYHRKIHEALLLDFVYILVDIFSQCRLLHVDLHLCLSKVLNTLSGILYNHVAIVGTLRARCHISQCGSLMIAARDGGDAAAAAGSVRGRRPRPAAIYATSVAPRARVLRAGRGARAVR